MNVKQSYSLKKHNTFSVEAYADEFIEINSEADLKEYFKICQDSLPFIILGGGSNILFRGNFSGRILKMNIRGIEIVQQDDSEVIVKAGAGIIWDELVNFTVTNNFAGLENLSLIPGTVGAAPIQNIGAYGQELSNVFDSLEAYNLLSGKKEIFTKDMCGFGYRESIFKREYKNKFIITAVLFRLSKIFRLNDTYEALKKEIVSRGIKIPSLKKIRSIIIEIRQSKLPDPELFGNAGSFFKNPEVNEKEFNKLINLYPDLKGFKSGDMFKIYAGWLIEKCGFKGVKEGNTGIYDRQALVIVNYGGATGEEIYEFASRVKQAVFRKFEIVLKEEVIII